MSKRPPTGRETTLSSQRVNPFSPFEDVPASSSTLPDAETGQTSDYWDDAIPDSFPSGDLRRSPQDRPPEAKRQRRGSTATLAAEPLSSTTQSQRVPRKLRVTKSLGPGDFAERQKPALFGTNTVQSRTASSNESVPSLTSSFESRVRHSSAPYGDSPQTPTPIAHRVFPPAKDGALIFPGQYRYPPDRWFAPPAGEEVNDLLPADRTTPPGAPHQQADAAPPELQPPALKEEDSYSIGASDEEDLAELMDSFCASATNIPPSSVIRSMDSGTSHEPVFDPNLPGSPPIKSEDDITPAKPTAEEEDLLDDEVDWDEIIQLLPYRPHDPSLSVSPKETAPRHLPKIGVPNTQQITPERKPFVRPPFPTPIRDKSPVAGFSRSSILRTCFRIGQILNEAKKCADIHQDVVFELYARVTYSSREKMARVQHFQFMDLFKEHLPYPTGTLNGWKTGSIIDEQSLVFVGSGDGQRAKLCRCICKPLKEKKRDLGWSFSVLAIRQADWEEIDMVRQMLCGV